MPRLQRKPDALRARPPSMAGRGPAQTCTNMVCVQTAQSREALLHDLHPQQVELEMQNVELRRAQLELAAARDRFVDLHDFAAVGYDTLDRRGVLVEANLTGAAMLGENRGTLLSKPLAGFVAPPDGDRWQRHLQQALALTGAQRIELALEPHGLERFDAQLDCLRVMQVGLAHAVRQRGVDKVSLGLRRQTGELLLDLRFDARVGAERGDGTGPEPAPATRALHEQAHLLGGQLELAETAGGGRRITVRLPLRRAADRCGVRARKDPT